MDFKRADRIAERIQRELSDLVLKKVNDPRIGFVTFTQVRVSDDLRNATVYVSVFGDEKKKSDTMEGLQSSLSFLQKEVFKRLAIKVSPKLYLKLDDTLEKGAKIDQLLKEIREEEGNKPKDDDDAAP